MSSLTLRVVILVFKPPMVRKTKLLDAILWIADDRGMACSASTLDRRQLSELNRRRFLQTGVSAAGMSLPTWLALQDRAAGSESGFAGKAKRCIILSAWGGMSHHETWDLKLDAPKEVRGEFKPIPTAVPGIQVGEHIPLLSKHTDKLAIVRSIHHTSSAHGMGMYWNMTGHPKPQPEVAANHPPSRSDWPSLLAMISKIRQPPVGVPPAVRLPYPLVDNSTLQSGEYGGWLGAAYDPIVMKTPKGRPFGGVSRDLGSPVLDMAEGLDSGRLANRRNLLGKLEPQPRQHPSFDHFRDLAFDMLLSPNVRDAMDLQSETQSVRDMYGDHICGQSVLLARRLVNAGIPIVTVCCAAGDLNGAAGDHYDTHSNNFNRLKNTMLPSFDRPAAALLQDLADRGELDETLVVFMTEFGRTPNINRSAGRDHYPHAYSVVLAGGGIRGGQVYGSTDRLGAHPQSLGCGPNDLHATIFKALGIPLDTHIKDSLGRPFAITDGQPLPLFA